MLCDDSVAILRRTGHVGNDKNLIESTLDWFEVLSIAKVVQLPNAASVRLLA